MPIPADFPEGRLRGRLLRRGQQHPPALPQRSRALEPRDLAGFMQTIRMQTEPKRTAVYLHVPSPDAGLSVQGQALPNLPGSVRAVFASKTRGPAAPIRSDLVTRRARPSWVVEGVAVAAVHGGQGCRALVIVVSM